MSSGDGPLNGSSDKDDPSTSLSAMLLDLLPCGGLVESVRPKLVGDARRSGRSSIISSGGGGEGSFGGGGGSFFFRIGYFLGSTLTCGGSFSFVSLGLLRRSNELSVPSGAARAGLELAAFFRLSSASLASFEDPPRSFGRGGRTIGMS